MNLYLISQTEITHYDTFSDAVVAAETEEEARTIHPDGNQRLPFEDSYPTWTKDPSKVKIKLIGKAVDGAPVGVICASFNAG